MSSDYCDRVNLLYDYCVKRSEKAVKKLAFLISFHIFFIKIITVRQGRMC